MILPGDFWKKDLFFISNPNSHQPKKDMGPGVKIATRHLDAFGPSCKMMTQTFGWDPPKSRGVLFFESKKKTILFKVGVDSFLQILLYIC